MPQIIVTTEDVLNVIESHGLNAKLLANTDELVSILSAHDLADMEIASSSFPFSFDAELDIELAPSPLTWLQFNDKYTNMYERVKGRVDNTLIQKEGEGTVTPVYRFVPINGQYWVAVLQRQPEIYSDPNKTLLSLNFNFFNDMIAQVLHTVKFETMCKSNLFSFYLKAFTPT